MVIYYLLSDLISVTGKGDGMINFVRIYSD